MALPEEGKGLFQEMRGGGQLGANLYAESVLTRVLVGAGVEGCADCLLKRKRDPAWGEKKKRTGPPLPEGGAALFDD